MYAVWKSEDRRRELPRLEAALAIAKLLLGAAGGRVRPRPQQGLMVAGLLLLLRLAAAAAAAPAAGSLTQPRVLQPLQRPPFHPATFSDDNTGATSSDVLYVSAAAAAGGDGSPGKPFASLGRAQAAVRKLLASAAGSGDVTVSIAGGAYFNTSLALTEADSPSPGGGQVSWQAAAGATVAVYGGARITGWTRSLNMRPGIWQATLPKELVDAEGRARFGTLVQDERSAWLARTPNFGSGYLPCGGSDSSFSCAAGVLPVGFDCQLSPGASGANNATSACSVFMRAGYSSDLRAVTGIVTNPTTQAVSVAFYHPGSGSRGDFYIQGALEFLDQEGEWAVHRGTLYYWPYSAHGMPLSPESLTITAPVTQRVFSFVGSSHAKRTRGITLSGLRIIGSSMPQTYIFMCRGNGPGASPHGASCGPDGGPDSVDETNTSPRGASEGMVYMENASDITVKNCALRAAGIAGFWFEEANENHTLEGNWVQDIAGFGLYSNGVEGGDRRYTGLEGDNNHGHTIHNNIFADGGRQIVYGTGVWLYQTGSTSITHNIIHRFPRDGVGFYGT